MTRGDYAVEQKGATPATAGEWRKIAFGEAIDFAIGGGWGQETAFPGSVKVSVIRGTDFKRILDGDYASVPQRYEKASKVDKRELRPGDVILEISGGSRTSNQSTGRSLLVSERNLNELGNRAIPASFCRLLRFDEEMVDPGYAYYSLQEMYFSGRAELYEQQFTGISTFQFTYFRDSEVLSLSPLPEQRAIAHVLGTLDDKIELNRRMNETLEEMARSLFKSWFVDFDPVRAKAALKQHALGHNAVPDGESGANGAAPAAEWTVERARAYLDAMDPQIADLFPDRLVDSELGEIPEGWEVADIGSLCVSITSGGTPARGNSTFWDHGTIPWYKTGELLDGPLIDSEDHITAAALDKSSAKLWPTGTVLFALYASPTVGRLGILANAGAANQAAAGLVAKPAYGTPFLRRLLITARTGLQSIAVGAAQQNLNQRVLRDFRIVVPDSAVAQIYSRLMASCDKHQVKVFEDIRTLTALRDSLLPALVSGELGKANSYKTILED